MDDWITPIWCPKILKSTWTKTFLLCCGYNNQIQKIEILVLNVRIYIYDLDANVFNMLKRIANQGGYNYCA